MHLNYFLIAWERKSRSIALAPQKGGVRKLKPASEFMVKGFEKQLWLNKCGYWSFHLCQRRKGQQNDNSLDLSLKVECYQIGIFYFITLYCC